MKKEVICHTHGFFSHRSDKNSSSHNSDSNNSNSNNSNSSNSSSSNRNSNKRETDRGGSFWLIHSLQGGDGMSPHRSGKSKFSKIMPLPFYVVFAAAVKNCNLPLQVPLIWRWRSPAAHLNIYKYRTYRSYFYDFTIFPASFCNSFLSALIRPLRLVIRRRSALSSYRMRIA